MTLAASQPQAQESAVPAPVGAVGVWLLRRCLTIFAWFLGIATLVTLVLVPPMIQHFQADITGSVWAYFARSGPSWFVFSLGISVSQYLPVLIAQGVTRRRFVEGAALALAGTALLVGVLVVVGYVVEARLFSAYGVEAATLGSIFGAGNQPVFVVVESCLRSLLFGLTGVLVGITYYRVGGWLGTALLPFTCIAPLALGLVIITQSLNAKVFDWAAMTPATTAGFGWLLAFEAVLLLVCVWVSSGTRLRAKAD